MAECGRYTVKPSNKSNELKTISFDIISIIVLLLQVLVKGYCHIIIQNKK